MAVGSGAAVSQHLLGLAAEYSGRALEAGNCATAAFYAQTAWLLDKEALRRGMPSEELTALVKQHETRAYLFMQVKLADARPAYVSEAGEQTGISGLVSGPVPTSTLKEHAERILEYIERTVSSYSPSIFHPVYSPDASAGENTAKDVAEKAGELRGLLAAIADEDFGVFTTYAERLEKVLTLAELRGVFGSTASRNQDSGDSPV